MWPTRGVAAGWQVLEAFSRKCPWGSRPTGCGPEGAPADSRRWACARGGGRRWGTRRELALRAVTGAVTPETGSGGGSTQDPQRESREPRATSGAEWGAGSAPTPARRRPGRAHARTRRAAESLRARVPPPFLAGGPRSETPAAGACVTSHFGHCAFSPLFSVPRFFIFGLFLDPPSVCMIPADLC